MAIKRALALSLLALVATAGVVLATHPFGQTPAWFALAGRLHRCGPGPRSITAPSAGISPPTPPGAAYVKTTVAVWTNARPGGI